MWLTVYFVWRSNEKNMTICLFYWFFADFCANLYLCNFCIRVDMKISKIELKKTLNCTVSHHFRHQETNSTVWWGLISGSTRTVFVFFCFYGLFVLRTFQHKIEDQNRATIPLFCINNSTVRVVWAPNLMFFEALNNRIFVLLVIFNFFVFFFF